MGTETSILRGIELGADMAGQNEVATGAQVAREVVSFIVNPASRISHHLTDGWRQLVLPDDLQDGPIANDMAVFHGALHSPDFQILGIGFSQEDIGVMLAERVLPASFLIGDVRKIRDADHIVDDHQDFIREMAERGVPGFSHGFMRKYNGDIDEYFAQVSLDGENVVTYLEDYDGPTPANLRPNDMWIRDTIEVEALSQIEHWASSARRSAQNALSGEFQGDELTIAVNTAISTGYQQLKGNAIIDTLAERGIDIRPEAENNATIARDSGSQIILPENGIGSGSTPTVAQAFSDFGMPTPGA